MEWRTLSPGKLFWLSLVLIITSICAIGCASNPADAIQVDPAVQETRSIQLATQMANNLQATNQVRFAYITATAEAFQNMLAGPKSWPSVISDDFEVDDGSWVTGESEDTLATINWGITEGTYNWQAEANSGFVWWVLPEADLVSRFYLAADVTLAEGPEDAEMGLVFRSDGESSYYTYIINNQGAYSVSLHSPSGWETLLEWGPSNDILVGQSNRLSVIAEGDRFLFFIHDRYQAGMQDDSLESGEAGLIIGLSYDGDEAAWVFDNYELRAPEDDQAEATGP